MQLEFNEKPESYSASPKAQEQNAVNVNPLDNLDCRFKDSKQKIKISKMPFSFKVESEDFKVGVNQLADVLQVPKHPVHLVTLEGICCLIQEKLSEEALKEALKSKKPGNPVQFDSVNFGLDIKAPNLSQAANVLRYLFIHDLRELQTKINECLVSVQALTANPKTDTKLGKVGY